MSKHLIFILLCLLLTFSKKDPDAAYSTISFNDHSFDVYLLDLSKDSLQLFWNDANGNAFGCIENLKRSLKTKHLELRFAMNAGMYKEDNSPLGLYIEKGSERIPLNTQSSAYGNFFMKPNGVFFLEDGKAEICTTKEFRKRKTKPETATQSGPMLVIDGRLHPAFNKNSTSTFIRNGIGMIDPSHLVFAISNEPVNFYNFASLFKEKYQCSDALYLDGAISKMYVQNHREKDLNGNLGPIFGVVSKIN